MPNSTQVDKLLSVTPTYAIARMSSPQPEGVTVSVYLYVGYTNKTSGWEVAATRGPESLFVMLRPDIGVQEIDWRKNQRLANARVALSRDEDVIAWFEARRARLDAFRGRWTPTDTTGITYIPGPDNGTLRPQKLAFELASLTDFQALAFDLTQGTMTAALMNIQNDGVWFVHSPAKEPVSPGYDTMYQWVEPLGSGWYFVRAANACGGNASTRWYCRKMR